MPKSGLGTHQGAEHFGPNCPHSTLYATTRPRRGDTGGRATPRQRIPLFGTDEYQKQPRPKTMTDDVDSLRAGMIDATPSQVRKALQKARTRWKGDDHVPTEEPQKDRGDVLEDDYAEDSSS